MSNFTYADLLEVVTKPSGFVGPRFGPAPQVHPFGPGYSLHPELSRSGFGYLLRSTVTSPMFFVPVGTVVATVMFHDAQRMVVGSLPQHRQSSMWRSIAQSMVGGFGVGSATSKFV